MPYWQPTRGFTHCWLSWTPRWHAGTRGGERIFSLCADALIVVVDPARQLRQHDRCPVGFRPCRSTPASTRASCTWHTVPPASAAVQCTCEASRALSPNLLSCCSTTAGGATTTIEGCSG